MPIAKCPRLLQQNRRKPIKTTGLNNTAGSSSFNNVTALAQRKQSLPHWWFQSTQDLQWNPRAALVASGEGRADAIQEGSKFYRAVLAPGGFNPQRRREVRSSLFASAADCCHIRVQVYRVFSTRLVVWPEFERKCQQIDYIFC